MVYIGQGVALCQPVIIFGLLPLYHGLIGGLPMPAGQSVGSRIFFVSGRTSELGFGLTHEYRLVIRNLFTCGSDRGQKLLLDKVRA